MSSSVASVSLNDPDPSQARQPPSRSQLPLPDSTPSSEHNELRVSDQWTNPTGGRMVKGKARPQVSSVACMFAGVLSECPQYYSPYARGERRHLVDQCTSAATWPHLPVPLPIVTSPNTPYGEATLQNELYEPAVTMGQLSPSNQATGNSGESSEIAVSLLPSLPLYSNC